MKTCSPTLAWISAFYFLLSTLTLPAQIVTGQVDRSSGSAATTRVVFTPTNYPLASGSRLILGGAISCTPSNGAFRQALVPNTYTVSFAPPAGTLTIVVPDNTNTFDILDLAVDLASYTYTNPFPSQRISSYVRPLTNVVFVTNLAGLPGEFLQIAATSTGGGGSMDYTITNSLASTNYVVAATNTLNTTLRAAASNSPTIYAPTILGELNATDEATRLGLVYAEDLVLTGGSYTGNGSGLTNLNADYIALGTLADARIASTLARDSEVADATNTLNTTLRSVLQLGSANLSNWSAVAVFSTNGLGDVSTASLNSASNVLRTAQINATNDLNTSLRVALAQTNITSATNITLSGVTLTGSITNLGNTGWAGPINMTNATSGSFIVMTNGGITQQGAAGFIAHTNGVLALGAAGSAAAMVVDGVSGKAYLNRVPGLDNSSVSIGVGTNIYALRLYGPMFGNSYWDCNGTVSGAGLISYSYVQAATASDYRWGGRAKMFSPQTNAITFCDSNSVVMAQITNGNLSASGSITATNGVYEYGTAGYSMRTNGVLALGANAAAAKITLNGVNGTVSTPVFNVTAGGVASTGTTNQFRGDFTILRTDGNTPVVYNNSAATLILGGSGLGSIRPSAGSDTVTIGTTSIWFPTAYIRNVVSTNVTARLLTTTNGITFAAGSTITNMVSYTSAMDIPSINSGASYTTNISVPNAKANDSVQLGLPDQGSYAGLLWTAWPSNGVVWLRAWNASAGAIDPASDTYRVTVTQF